MEFLITHLGVIVFVGIIAVIAVLSFAFSVWEGMRSMRRYAQHTRKMMSDQQSGRPLPSGWGSE